MAEPWTPPLRLSEHACGCRLTLEGLTCGHGESLQEAADDLIARLQTVALAVRRGGMRAAPELGGPDHRLLEFVWQLGEVAARGEDIRAHVLGTAPQPRG
jgi:hypothetical protein